MGLAEPVGGRHWTVRRDFEAVLRAMKRGRDRQKTLASHGAALQDDRQPFVTVDWRKQRLIEGRIVVHGEDEVGPTAGRPYLLVEGNDGKVHHVPYSPEIHDLRRRGLLRSGAMVRLRRMWVDGRPALEVEEMPSMAKRPPARSGRGDGVER